MKPNEKEKRQINFIGEIENPRPNGTRWYIAEYYGIPTLFLNPKGRSGIPTVFCLDFKDKEDFLQFIDEDE